MLPPTVRASLCSLASCLSAEPCRRSEANRTDTLFIAAPVLRYGWINFALASKMESGEFEFQQAAVSLRLRALSSAQVGTNLLQGWEHVSLFVTPQPLSWIGPWGAPSAGSVHHSSFLSASLLFPTPSCFLFILYQQYRASVAQCCWLWVQTEQLHNSSSLLSGTCFVNLWLLSHSQHGPSFGLGCSFN